MRDFGAQPNAKRLANGGVIRAENVDAYVKLARDAVAGRKKILISHSEIFPGTYASTTECVDHLLTTLDIKRKRSCGKAPQGCSSLARSM